jgi:hypothetical protein
MTTNTLQSSFESDLAAPSATREEKMHCFPVMKQRFITRRLRGSILGKRFSHRRSSWETRDGVGIETPPFRTPRPVHQATIGRSGTTETEALLAK